MKTKAKYSSKLKKYYKIEANAIFFDDGCIYSIEELSMINNSSGIDICAYHQRKLETEIKIGDRLSEVLLGSGSTSIGKQLVEFGLYKFWDRLFQHDKILTEKELIERICIDNGLDATAKNITLKLNEIFHACNIGLIKDLGQKCPVHQYCLNHKN